MLKIFVLLSSLVVLLCGCASGKLVGKPPIIENDNFATVHIARPAGFAGCGVRTTIELDYEEFYWLACGEYITFRVPANKVITISQSTSTRPDHLDIEPEKSKQYYFENDCGGWTCWLQETNKNKFMHVAKKCKEVINIGY